MNLEVYVNICIYVLENSGALYKKHYLSNLDDP